jgi:hypothetical protein
MTMRCVTPSQPCKFWVPPSVSRGIITYSNPFKN